MGSITHTFVSAIPDDPASAAAGEVVPSNWNDNHTFSLDKTDVGLGNVDNTSDADKPVSTATQTALDTKQATLVSGTNLKTINGSTLLGSGDLSTTQTSVTGNAGTATALQTAQAIYGNNFDGTSALTQVIASTYGGTGNGFTKISGPASTEKTFSLPNASATILTDNAAVTVAQGGTGVATLTAYAPIFGGTTGTAAVQSGTVGTTGHVLTSNGAGSLPTFQAPAGASVQALCVRNEQSVGTNGGSVTAASWNTMVLNTTVSNSITGASRSSNQVTLPAGTYSLTGFTPLGNVTTGRLRIQNITDTTTALAGFNFNSTSTTGTAYIEGTFTLAAAKVIEFQIWPNTNAGGSASGLGLAASIGSDNEIFGGFTVTKIA